MQYAGTNEERRLRFCNNKNSCHNVKNDKDTRIKFDTYPESPSMTIFKVFLVDIPLLLFEFV